MSEDCIAQVINYKGRSIIEIQFGNSKFGELDKKWFLMNFNCEKWTDLKEFNSLSSIKRYITQLAKKQYEERIYK